MRIFDNFLVCWSEQVVQQIIEFLVDWGAMTLLRPHCNVWGVSIAYKARIMKYPVRQLVACYCLLSWADRNVCKESIYFVSYIVSIETYTNADISRVLGLLNYYSWQYAITFRTSNHHFMFLTSHYSKYPRLDIAIKHTTLPLHTSMQTTNCMYSMTNDRL